MRTSKMFCRNNFPNYLISLLMLALLSACGGGGGGGGSCSIDCGSITSINITTYAPVSKEWCADKGASTSCTARWSDGGEFTTVYPTSDPNTPTSYSQCRDRCRELFTEWSTLPQRRECLDTCDLVYNSKTAGLVESNIMDNNWSISNSTKNLDPFIPSLTDNSLNSNMLLKFIYVDGEKRQLRIAIIRDIDGDGYPDIVALDDNAGDILLFFNNGDMTYRKNDRPIKKGVISVAVADINGDSVLDLCVLNSDSHSVSILLGYGSGLFQRAAIYPVGMGFNFIGIDDHNNDGYKDIYLANFESNKKLNLAGNGDGSFYKE